MISIEKVVEAAAALGASDIHIVKGIPIRFRIDGSMENFDSNVLTEEDCYNICHEMAGDRLDEIKEIGELDFAETFAGVRTRLNVFRQQGSYSAALRLLKDRIPSIDSLSLPPVISTFAKYKRGIVLVTGETGSGKSTTLAALLDSINHTYKKHIITLENPIEYIYTPDLCTINQREIGEDTKSFAAGLRASLREDPDVILVGEMRDLDTIETALTAAETGHLVFATLHTSSAAESVDRIVNVFPEGSQRQIRIQLSMALKAIVSQQLLVRNNSQGRIVACEVMVVNSAIRSLIREGKTPQINNTMATSASEGCITMDNCLAELVMSRKITANTAVAAASDPDYLKKLIRY